MGDDVFAGDGVGGRDLACDNVSGVDGHRGATTDAAQHGVVLCLETRTPNQVRVGDLSCRTVDVSDGGAIEIAQDVAGLEAIEMRVVANGLGPNSDPRVVLRLLEQAQGSPRVDILRDRDRLVRRPVEAERRSGGSGRPAQVCLVPEQGERHTEQCRDPPDQGSPTVLGRKQGCPFDRHKCRRSVVRQRLSRHIQNPSTDGRLDDDTCVHLCRGADIVVMVADLHHRQPPEQRAHERNDEDHEHPQSYLVGSAGGHRETHARRRRISARSARINSGTTTRPRAVVNAIDHPAATHGTGQPFVTGRRMPMAATVPAAASVANAGRDAERPLSRCHSPATPPATA